jgi:hypothetical protein
MSGMKALVATSVLLGVVVLFVSCGALSLLFPAGPGRPRAEISATALAERVLPAELSAVALNFQQEVRTGGEVTGYRWRVAPAVASSGTSVSPTHLGVLTCVRGERAVEAARFSFLHWEPAGCEQGRPVLREVVHSPEQDERDLGSEIGPPGELERSDRVQRATAEQGTSSPDRAPPAANATGAYPTAERATTGPRRLRR